MTTLDESTIAAQPTLEPSENDTARPEAQAWQLGILTDRAGRVHLGAVVAGTGNEPCSYIDLLAPVGACSAGELDLDKHLVVLVHGKELADLRRLAERCIDDARLRQQLVQLADLAAS
jgi:hypothetical protein